MSYELEMKLVNRLFYKVCDDPQEIEKILAVDIKLFTTPEIVSIMSMAKLRYRENKAIELDLLKGFTVELLRDIDLSESTGTTEEYVTELKDERVKRELRKIADSYGQKDKTKLLGDLDKVIREATSETKTRTKFTLKQLGGVVFNNLDNPRENFIKTGWPYFDDMVKLSKGDMHIIGGRPGTGKTAFGLMMAMKLAHNGAKGLYFSMEMSELSVGQRMMSACSGVPLSCIMDPEKYAALDEKGLHNINKALEIFTKIDSNLEIIAGTNTLHDIKNMCLLAKEHGLDFVVVDYLGLIRHQAKDIYTRMTEVSLGLKAIAMEMDLSIIALAQLSRENQKRTDKTPMMSDLRDSGGLEQDASTITFVHRDDDDAENDKDRLRVIVNKNRMGACGEIDFNFNRGTQKIEERKKCNVPMR